MLSKTPRDAPPIRHSSVISSPSSNFNGSFSSLMSQQPGSMRHGTRSWTIHAAEMGNDDADPSDEENEAGGNGKGGYDVDQEERR